MKFVILLALLLPAPSAFAQNGIDAEETVVIGGLQQHITLQGRDRSLPLLLFLHGGPGGSVMAYADKFSNQLQDHFVVIHWDQRETGRTRELNRSSEPLTLAVFQEDTRQMIGYLLTRFHRKKLYLAGHSWGTALGFHVAAFDPERLYALLAIGPMIHQQESERIALALMTEKASAAGSQQQLEELSSVRIPFENGRQLYFHRKGLQEYAGKRSKLSSDYVERWADTWLRVFNEASRINLMDSLPVVHCPVYFFLGRKDLQTNSTLAEEYFTRLNAPRKALFWFESSAHAVPTTEPRRLQALIIEKVLPETFTLQKPEAVIGQSLITEP